MPRVLLLSMLLVISMLLPGCVPFAEQFTPAVPTIGPVQGLSGSTNRTTAVIQANTNCAEIGEMVTFTASFTNTVPYTVTITTEPIMDIVLSPANWDPADGPEPIQRWSESEQYPHDFATVVEPGEEWVYQWRWQADAVYGAGGVNGVRAQLQMGQVQLRSSAIPSGGPQVAVGVEHMTWGNGIECTQLER
ncbi:MAG: hypothetical protein GFH27_549325n3 [Chloroflexi bacterium AL-W]|nr:hypothetical protein [Chloroflexi bacterium AL-N1]NOK70149.1 hypothetical protein [Chloroflexi bacterium AL-N10]NOK77841.1 hypothetical protein [Chloroflexi bacterium AL-N5]NOK84850.1 hypothetical protein [Chloroflexi bacterium AL-W]